MAGFISGRAGDISQGRWFSRHYLGSVCSISWLGREKCQHVIWANSKNNNVVLRKWTMRLHSRTVWIFFLTNFHTCCLSFCFKTAGILLRFLTSDSSKMPSFKIWRSSNPLDRQFWMQRGFKLGIINVGKTFKIKLPYKQFTYYDMLWILDWYQCREMFGVWLGLGSKTTWWGLGNYHIIKITTFSIIILDNKSPCTLGHKSLVNPGDKVPWMTRSATRDAAWQVMLEAWQQCQTCGHWPGCPLWHNESRTGCTQHFSLWSFNSWKAHRIRRIQRKVRLMNKICITF